MALLLLLAGFGAVLGVDLGRVAGVFVVLSPGQVVVVGGGVEHR
ncbi:hypothetical protein [Micromonospora sp. RV43]|nr:hypothetical protein [Micromonospora sp. RV43]